jgi:arylsulfatase A-like enzyme/Flp pilus assembly protein TadD
MKAFRFLLLYCLTATAWVGSGAQKAPPPDVFLVSIDTLRADHVHCYGYDKIETPALDSLAQDGIRFEQAFTPSPITNISHSSILTGLLPSDHGVKDFAVPLSPDHPLLAELLKPQGYHTAAFIGAVVLDSKQLAPGLDRGFDFYDNFPQDLDPKVHWGRLERRGMEVVQRAETWLSGQPSGPRFVWVHMYDPHDPYEPPEPFLSTYKDRPYDGEIAYADSALGHFVSFLKKQGWYDGAVVVVVADHGEGLGEHHEDTHGIFLYDSTTHVPLIVKLPSAQAKGKQVAAQVRTTDILPTVLDLVGAKAPARLDGESLRPYFSGTESAGRPAFGETDYPLHFGWAPLRSVRDSGMKFIEAPRPELYDLHSDPKELNNTYEPWNANVQKLRGMLAELRKKMPQPTQVSDAAVRKGTTDELHALGYLTLADGRTSTNVPEPSLLPDAKDKIDQKDLHQFEAILFTENQVAGVGADPFRQSGDAGSNSAADLLQTGQMALAANDYAVAVDFLRRAMQASPGDATVAFYYGQALQMAGDLPGARDALQTSLKADPNQLPARLALGQVYLGLKDTAAAEDQVQAALLLDPASVEARLNLAQVLIAEQKFNEAVTQLLAATHSAPGNAEAYALLSQAYTGLGKKEKALAAASRAKALEKREKPH